MKIAIWSEGRWALKRIHDSIVKYVKGHEIHVFNWMHTQENSLFFQTWESYDLILGNTAITYLPKDTGYLKEMPKLYLSRCLSFLHCPVIDDPSGFHTEKILSYLPQYAAVSKDAQKSLEGLGISAPYIPFGVDTDLFYEAAKERTIKKAGFVGRGSVIKNDSLFKDICKAANLEPVFLYDRTPETLYSDIDILINCSKFECGPLGNFEAAAMGRPVLSKKLGNWSLVKSAKFYDTLEDALVYFQTYTEKDWYIYAKELQAEVLSLWNNKLLIETYLQPILDTFGTSFDFVELGSCDYDTLCDPKKKGLLVEPLEHCRKHLTNLVEPVAIYEGPEPYVQIFYTTDYHDWRRGCNKILEPHPTVPYAHTKYVPTLSWKALLQKYSIRYIDHLKITTEGYDSTILQAVLKTIESGLLIRKITCLWNELVPKFDLKCIPKEYRIQETSTFLYLERSF